jgi:hypothetical protein
MEHIQIYYYVTNLISLKDFDQLQILLDTDQNVQYWYLDKTSPDNKLIMVGKDLDDIMQWLEENGYISQMDTIY